MLQASVNFVTLLSNEFTILLQNFQANFYHER